MNELIELNEEAFEKVLRDNVTLLGRACSGKYIHNAEIGRRFALNANNEGCSLEVSEAGKGEKVVDSCEYISCELSFFERNRLTMEANFRERCLKKVPEDKFDKYITIMSGVWVKGASATRSREVKSLYDSVVEFLKTREDNPCEYIRKPYRTTGEPLFTVGELTHLLITNSELINLYFSNFAEHCREQGYDISTSEFWLHRGVHLKDPFENGSQYVENRFLTSYTISVSIMEKFAQIIPDKKVALISGQLYDLKDQVFAFAPFIPGMPITQMEVVLMPSTKVITMDLVHEDGKLYDYELSVPRR
ncbi:hypothetical protein PDESU_00355 [Pontiella desulfatans]|uniref:Uncharacterized protein n=1 Tax=Pontiella desulfatans TaxID=2750659 RepID=A0A6C2TVW3_PONDE|nr:hypothetical protein [Pontiella desulfatans]VGO11808.1 hypothetical protein PDESU_00355 [Pontiella desulfatans]